MLYKSNWEETSSLWKGDSFYFATIIHVRVIGILDITKTRVQHFGQESLCFSDCDRKSIWHYISKENLRNKEKYCYKYYVAWK